MFIFYILLQIILPLVLAGTSPRVKTLTKFSLVTPGQCTDTCAQSTRTIQRCDVAAYRQPTCRDICTNAKIDELITCVNCIYTTTSACRDVPYKDWEEMYETLADWKDYCTRQTYEVDSTVQWAQWAPYNHTAAVNSTTSVNCTAVPPRRIQSAASRRVQFGSKLGGLLFSGVGVIAACVLL